MEMKDNSAGPRYVVVGVGNPYMKDDGIGIAVVRELKKRDLGSNVLVLERQLLDISLLLLTETASRLIIVDAVRSGRLPGTLVRFEATGRRSPGLNVPLSHDIRLTDIISLARENRIALCPMVVIGVEPADCTIGEGMTKSVRESLATAVEAVTVELKKPHQGGR